MLATLGSSNWQLRFTSRTSLATEISTPQDHMVLRGLFFEETFGPQRYGLSREPRIILAHFANVNRDFRRSPGTPIDISH